MTLPYPGNTFVSSAPVLALCTSTTPHLSYLHDLCLGTSFLPTFRAHALAGQQRRQGMGSTVLISLPRDTIWRSPSSAEPSIFMKFFIFFHLVFASRPGMFEETRWIQKQLSEEGQKPSVRWDGVILPFWRDSEATYTHGARNGNHLQDSLATLSVASWPGICVGGEVGGSQGSQVSPTSSLPTAGGPPHLRVLPNFNNLGKLRTSLSVRGCSCSQVLAGRRRDRSVGQGHVAATYVRPCRGK